MLFAIVGLAISLSGVIDQTFMSLAFSTPDFDYSIGPNGEQGNATFDVYVIMRSIGGGLVAVVLIYGGLARVFESADLGVVNQGTSNRLFTKSVIFLLIMLVFPPAWDALSDLGDNASLWIVNPLYTFDDERPCPDAFYADIDGVWTYQYTTSPYILWGDKRSVNPNQEDLRRQPPNLNQRIDTMEQLCKPELRVNYVFGQMLRNTEVNQMRDEFGFPGLNATGPVDSAWMDARSGDILSGATGAFTNLMLGLTKALVAIQVLILTVLIGVMTDLLVHMVIAALPVFLVLSVLPYCDRIVGRFIEAVPALLLLPMLTAIIVSVGAAGIAEAPSSADGSPYTNPDEWASAGGDEEAQPSANPYDHVYTWITALGVVFFAITLPTILVPWISSSLHMAQGVVSSAVQSSSLIAGSAATGAASGMAQARAGGGGWGSVLRGGMMGAAATGMHAMGSAGMPMSGLGPGPGEVAKGAMAAQAASQAGAASAQAAAQKLDRVLESEAGKDVSPRDSLAVQQAGPQGPNGKSLLPGWDPQLRDERNGMRLHQALFKPGEAGHDLTRDITMGNRPDEIRPNAIDAWANVAGDSRAKLGNPELSTSQLDAMAKEQAGPNGDVAGTKARMIDHSMEMRGLDHKNPKHEAAFMSDLAANDKAIQDRGGADYPHDKWWNDESNEGHHHRGSWEATNNINPKPDAADAGAAGAAGGGGGGSGGAQGGQGGWEPKPSTAKRTTMESIQESQKITDSWATA